jgi:hypothetical protein
VLFDAASDTTAGRRIRGVLLGGISTMTAANRDAGPASDDAPLERALSMLANALEILDAEGVPPEFGARLQGVVEELREYRSGQH